MNNYFVKYVDDRGDFQKTDVTSTDVRSAIDKTLNLCPDAKRIIRCVQKPVIDHEQNN